MAKLKGTLYELERYVANVEGFRNVIGNSLMLSAVSSPEMNADMKIVLYDPSECLAPLLGECNSRQCF